MATTCYGYMHENAEYQELSSRTQPLWTQVRDLESEQRQAMFKIQALLATVDVVRNHMYSLEDVSKAADKALEKYTTEDSECWFGTYGAGLDEMRDRFVDICTVVHNRKVDIETVKTHIKEINKKKDALGDKLRAEFHAKEEAVTNV